MTITPNDQSHVRSASGYELSLRATDALHGTWSDEAIRRQWSERETARIVDSDLRMVDAARTELSKLEFRRLAAFVFADFPKLRRQALLSGQILMGDGRVIRRANHVDMTKDAA